MTRDVVSIQMGTVSINFMLRMSGRPMSWGGTAMYRKGSCVVDGRPVYRGLQRCIDRSHASKVTQQCIKAAGRHSGSISMTEVSCGSNLKL